MGGDRSSSLAVQQLDTHVRDVRRYYHSVESVLGYRLMVHGVKHFGWHDDPSHPSSILVAQLRQNDVIAQKLGLKSNANVLKCGCGEGSSANYLAKNYDWRITGVDLLPRNIARAKKQSKHIGISNDFLVTDYMNLPFDGEAFDGVYAMETLVHAPDAVALFKGIRRVLKPGGKLVFCEYSMNPRNKLNVAEQRLMTIMNTVGAMPALEQFTTDAFPDILKRSGFKKIEVADVTSHITPTLKYFHDQARIPNKVIKALHLEKHFVNAYCAAEIYDAFTRGDHFMRYNLVSAVRDK